MAWWIWAVIALGLGIIEVTTFTFVLLWVAIAALATAVLAPLLPNIWVELFVFVLTSVVLLILTRPLVRKWKQHRTYPTRMETLPGREGVVVTEAIPGAFATVRVEGDLWSARSEDHLEVGQSVIVLSSSATVLTVKRIVEGD